jgi:hypothetical protein
MRRHLVISVFIACGIAVGPTSGRCQKPAGKAHPDFTGQWTIDLTRSQLAPPFRNITAGTAYVEHRDPVFSFSRVFTIDGRETTVRWSLATDGKETAGTEGGMPIRQTLTWRGDTLVFITVFQAPRGEARNTVRYLLLDDGTTLRAEESFRGPRVTYDNLWVFTKAP